MSGRHEEDPKPLRCKLGWHKYVTRNVVWFVTDPTRYDLRQCERCDRWTRRHHKKGRF